MTVAQEEIFGPVVTVIPFEDEKEAIRIKVAGPQHLAPISHFGSGVLTFHVNALFRTEPGINLWVTGPVAMR